MYTWIFFFIFGYSLVICIHTHTECLIFCGLIHSSSSPQFLSTVTHVFHIMYVHANIYLYWAVLNKKGRKNLLPRMRIKNFFIHIKREQMHECYMFVCTQFSEETWKLNKANKRCEIGATDVNMHIGLCVFIRLLLLVLLLKIQQCNVIEVWVSWSMVFLKRIRMMKNKAHFFEQIRQLFCIKTIFIHP